MSFGKTSTRFLVLVTVCLCGAVGDSVAGPLDGSTVLRDESGAAIQTGVKMERSRRWLEAIEHYEESLEHWPQNKELRYGLRRSKIHFSIERRYTDRSFESVLLRKSRRELLSLFDDVLGLVRSHYVDPISSTSFVAHGTESLYLALANKKFVNRHLSAADSGDIQRMRKILRDQFWNKPVAHRAAARQTVTDVCVIADTELGLSSSAVVTEYIFGGCNALDDYSSYLTTDRLDDLYGNIEGEFVGLGIEMKAEVGKGLLLVNVLPDSPAEEGGMRRGDHIVGIDGTSCRYMTTDEAARLLRGPVGSRVRLQVQPPTDESLREETFFRRAVQVKSVPIVKIIDRKNGIGYIQMSGFQKTSVSELDSALGQLRRQGMRALIWDVRGNPGGLLTAAVEVLDRFIDKGVIVSTKGRTRDQNWTYSAHRPGTSDLPLVLLVDGESASASEIVAGAVRDHRRGMIVGRQTYGKWSVQTIFPLRGSTGMRLTTARFYSPRGRTLGKIGVRPDVVVGVAQKRKTYYRGALDFDVDGDADLQKGIEILRRQIARQ